MALLAIAGAPAGCAYTGTKKKACELSIVSSWGVVLIALAALPFVLR